MALAAQESEWTAAVDRKEVKDVGNETRSLEKSHCQKYAWSKHCYILQDHKKEYLFYIHHDIVSCGNQLNKTLGVLISGIPELNAKSK